MTYLSRDGVLLLNMNLQQKTGIDLTYQNNLL